MKNGSLKTKSQKAGARDDQILTPTITKEKKSHDKTQLKFLDEMKFIYGSVQINYKFDGIRYRKYPQIKGKWKGQSESRYDSSCNGLYVLTGPISNFFVIDIDDVLCESSKYIII